MKNNQQRLRVAHKPLFTIIAVLSSGGLHAASEWGATAGLGAEYHSNAQRVSTDEESDLARIATLGLTWRNQDAAVEGDAAYQITRRDFADNEQRDENAIDGRTNLQWNVAPRTFDVFVQHLISTSLTNSQEADTSDNRERRSVLTGGVNGYLNLSPRDVIAIRPSYTDIQFSRSDESDSQRATADVSWQHRVSQVSNFVVSTNYSDVKFDDESQDYDASTVTVGYNTQLARLSYSVDVGHSWFKRDDRPDVDGNNFRVAANYLTETAEYGLSVVRDLTDSSIGLAQEEFTLPDFTSTDSNFDQVDVLTRTRAELTGLWNLSALTRLEAAVGFQEDDYETTPRDQEEYYGRVGVNHTLNSYWTVSAQGRYGRQRFLDGSANGHYDNTLLTVGATYRFNPSLSVTGELTRDDRRAEESSLDYTDNIAIVTVNYRFF